VEGKILAEELLDSAMMTMRTTKAGEEKLDKNPSLYQQYLAKLKAGTRRFLVDSQHGGREAVMPSHEFIAPSGALMRSYNSVDGMRLAKAILSNSAESMTSI
tara:strand:- start:94 stop:399 length:306 start_codon:yes stop_codon:yes gene_type:complete